ncbi:MAG: hypothetical protein M3R01_10195 [Actinomycetota bacterium]|nr:hypothetical protein [Actinomycetota bacterium]
MHNPRSSTALRHLADLTATPAAARWSWATARVDAKDRVRLLRGALAPGPGRARGKVVATVYASGADESSVPGRRDTGEQLSIVGELHGVLERQSGGAAPVTGNNKRGDLDDLALTSSVRTSLLLCTGDVAGCGDVVVATRSHHGEQGVLDGEVSHFASLRRGADARLTSH